MSNTALIQRILDALADKQKEQRNLGMVNTAQGLAYAIVIVGRIEAEGEPSIDTGGES